MAGDDVQFVTIWFGPCTASMHHVMCPTTMMNDQHMPTPNLSYLPRSTDLYFTCFWFTRRNVLCTGTVLLATRRLSVVVVRLRYGAAPACFNALSHKYQVPISGTDKCGVASSAAASLQHIWEYLPILSLHKAYTRNVMRSSLS